MECPQWRPLCRCCHKNGDYSDSGYRDIWKLGHSCAGSIHRYPDVLIVTIRYPAKSRKIEMSMSLTRQQALDYFRTDDLIGLGMEADAIRRKLHPEGVVTYIIDRNINYTNFCTEYCTFCAFY